MHSPAKRSHHVPVDVVQSVPECEGGVLLFLVGFCAGQSRESDRVLVDVPVEAHFFAEIFEADQKRLEQVLKFQN